MCFPFYFCWDVFLSVFPLFSYFVFPYIFILSLITFCVPVGYVYTRLTAYISHSYFFLFFCLFFYFCFRSFCFLLFVSVSSFGCLILFLCYIISVGHVLCLSLLLSISSLSLASLRFYNSPSFIPIHSPRFLSFYLRIRFDVACRCSITACKVDHARRSEGC